MQKILKICIFSFVLIITGCTSIELERAPASHDQPWVADQNVVGEQSPGYSVPKVDLPKLDEKSFELDPNRALSLPELIDIAQQQNPLTRKAWNAARAAALGVGAIEATFLPQLSANVIAGQMRNHYPLKHSILGHDAIDTKSTATVPFLAVTWLLFDFGQRSALLEAAEQVSFASNVLFNASHQKVIRDVTDQYYQYLAAKQRVSIATQSIKQQQSILNAANARYQGGLGTTLDVALAKQAVAQAKLHLVNSQGIEKTSKLGLLAAMGLPAGTDINIADNKLVDLPANTATLTDQALEQALNQRPDVVAQYAEMKATQANVKAAEAAFLPKVFLGAIYGKQRNTFQMGNLPGIDVPSSGNGIGIGVSLPIFDGGIRRNNLRTAEIAAEQAQDNLQSLQRDAVREIVIAETALKSSLQSYATAKELVSTAQTAYNGALEAYKEGVGTITMATETATQLLQAKQARTDAKNAALISAANLAFATGSMVQAKDNWM